jgi:hypothetical protein
MDSGAEKLSPKGFPKRRYWRECARGFKPAWVECAYYKGPTRASPGSLATDVPEDVQFAFKIMEQITGKRFPKVVKSGISAATPKENFLNPGLFGNGFPKPCAGFHQDGGLRMFEFSRFHPSEYGHHGGFGTGLDEFRGAFPPKDDLTECNSKTEIGGRPITSIAWVATAPPAFPITGPQAAGERAEVAAGQSDEA